MSYQYQGVNIDPETGIRFGVISPLSIAGCRLEDFENDYGEPSCPDCGGQVVPSHRTEDGDKDFTCLDCVKHTRRPLTMVRGRVVYVLEKEPSCFWAEEVYPEEPVRVAYNRRGYRAELCRAGTELIFLKSPYYTYANLCSPCVPNAGNLDEPRTEHTGYRTYCPGPKWFADGIVAFDIHAVDTDALVAQEEYAN